MKTTKFLLGIVVTTLAIGFSSCKKTDTAVSSDKDEIEITIELSGNQAIADNLTEDVNDIYMEAATEKGLAGETPLTPFQSLGNLGCATITVTPLLGFPKNIVIDFGNGCVSPNGITRKGKINILVSDSLRKTGTTSVLTFDGYFVNGFKKEGTITWTNNSTANSKGWQRKVENGKITSPTGKSWFHNGIKTIVQTDGYSTPRNLLDDAFSITGSSTITNANSISRTSTIIIPLQKKTICESISKGSIELKSPNHTAVIDFGDGICDYNGTIALDGGAAFTIKFH